MTSPNSRRHALTIGIAGLAIAAVGVAPALASTSAAHKSPKPVAKKDQPVVAGSRYLALGDSVSFGYRESNSIPKPNYAKPKSIIGFPEDVAKNLGLKLANAACPGETTASFLNAAAQSNGCLNHYSATGTHKVAGGYRTMNPLHVGYKSKKQSQLAYAEAYLKKHPNTRLVTLMIGANDGFLCQNKYTDKCVGELGILEKTLTANTKKIFAGLRNTAHYKGQIVLVSYYSTDYADSLATLESNAVTGALVKATKGYDVKVADGFGQFKKAAAQAHGNTCAAQLLTQTPTAKTPCGVHPSIAGQALLAQAVEQAVKK